MRINLLPHREQKRLARQRQFVTLAISLAILGAAIVALVHVFLAARIDNQLARNTYLKQQIAKLDEQIKEIDRLRDQIQQVLARKAVVETLQGVGAGVPLRGLDHYNVSINALILPPLPTLLCNLRLSPFSFHWCSREKEVDLFNSRPHSIWFVVGGFPHHTREGPLHRKRDGALSPSGTPWPGAMSLG